MMILLYNKYAEFSENLIRHQKEPFSEFRAKLNVLGQFCAAQMLITF